MYFFWPLSWYSNYLIPGYTSPPIRCFCLSLWDMPPTSTSQPQLTSSLHARGEETPPNHSVSLLPGPNFLSQSRLSTSFLTENQSSRDQKRRKQSRLMWWSSSMGNKWVDVRMRSALCCKSWAMEAKSRAGRQKGGRTEGSHTGLLAPSLSSGESSKLCTWVARAIWQGVSQPNLLLYMEGAKPLANCKSCFLSPLPLEQRSAATTAAQKEVKTVVNTILNKLEKQTNNRIRIFSWKI